MRITEALLRKIIREELIREVESTKGTTTYDEDLPAGSESPMDPLMKSLKSAAANGHTGVVVAIMSGKERPLMRAVGDGQHYEATDFPKYQEFLDSYINFEVRQKYEKAFQDLADNKTKGYVRIPPEDFKGDLADTYVLMGVYSKSGSQRTDASGAVVENSFTIDQVHDYRRYTVQQTFNFLKSHIEPNYTIKVYDYIEGQDKEGEGRLIYPKSEEPAEAAEDRSTWVAAVTKVPLRKGASGDNVKIAQELLVKALNRFAERPIGSVGPSADRLLKSLIASKKLTGSTDKLQDLAKELAQKIQDSGPDGKFGPMTEAAVYFIQSAPGVGLAGDGVIGKETARVLVAGVRRKTDAEFAKSGSLEETLLRWNRLAGLVKG